MLAKDRDKLLDIAGHLEADLPQPLWTRSHISQSFMLSKRSSGLVPKYSAALAADHSLHQDLSTGPERPFIVTLVPDYFHLHSAASSMTAGPLD